MALIEGVAIGVSAAIIGYIVFEQTQSIIWGFWAFFLSSAVLLTYWGIEDGNF